MICTPKVSDFWGAYHYNALDGARIILSVELLNQLGFDFGVCRRPFYEPTDEEKALIKREIIPFI